MALFGFGKRVVMVILGKKCNPAQLRHGLGNLNRKVPGFCEMNFRKNDYMENNGMTIPELLIALLIAGLLIGGTMLSLKQYRKMFQKREEKTTVMIDAGRFIQYFRDDIQNAAPPAHMEWVKMEQQFIVSSETISFPVFTSDGMATETITYSREGRDLFRQIGTQKYKLVRDGIVSMNWRLEGDGFDPREVSRVPRLWISFDGQFGSKDPFGNYLPYIRIQTRFFPFRFNRAMQNRP
ncbi:MAG: prepilin-type N-terminal cleavage/methylation domain-containing protein [Candidatus Riflebacteria bacterium]|nr:prepilin-type N-terminal cleavage/methylation domain-containing protein [Candidatus Riflebacteria bacterium]